MSVMNIAEPILSVVYVSSAAALLSDEELLTLLSQARRNNAQRSITGMLLYEEGNFMQAIEGPEAAVRETLQKIRVDPRHRGIQKLLEQRIPEREFGSWTMGYRNLADVPEDDQKAFRADLSESAFDAELQRTRTNASKLLNNFRTRMRLGI